MSIEKQHYFRTDFFNQPDFMSVIYDRDLNCIDISFGFLQLFDLTQEECIGKNISDPVFDSISTERLGIFKTVYETGQSMVVDNFITRINLNSLHYRIRIFKLEIGIGVELFDVTDLKESIKDLETFIFKSSHDMRAPLASVLGLLSILENENNEIDEMRSINKMIHQQIIQLESKLKIMVDSTRLRLEEKNIYPINFNEIMSIIESTLVWMNGYETINIEKKIELIEEFYSDKNLIISLFQNIIENAIKYQRNNVNSFLVISITGENNGALITFTDNGIGIPSELQNDVFKMFFRATDTSTGSGLGLYTVSHTVKKLKGEIKMESKEGMGTKFSVFLPNLFSYI